MCFKNILRKKSAYNLHLANYIENNLLIWMTQFDITLLNKSFKTDKKYKSSFDKQKCNRLNKKICHCTKIKHRILQFRLCYIHV